MRTKLSIFIANLFIVGDVHCIYDLNSSRPFSYICSVLYVFTPVSIVNCGTVNIFGMAPKAVLPQNLFSMANQPLSA